MQLFCQKPSKDFPGWSENHPSALYHLPLPTSQNSSTTLFPSMPFFSHWGPLFFLNVTILFPPLGFAPAVAVFAHNRPHPPQLHPHHVFTGLEPFSLLLFVFCLDIIFSEASDNDHLKILLVNCFKCTLALIPCISFITIQKGLIFIFVNLMSILPNLDDKSHESRGLICLMSWHTDSSKCVRYSWHSINNRIFVIRDWGNTMQNSFLREKEGNSVNERRENVQIKIHFSHLIVCHSYLYGQLIIPTNSQEWFIYHQSAF